MKRDEEKGRAAGENQDSVIPAKIISDLLWSNLQTKFEEATDITRLMSDLLKYFEDNRDKLPPGFTPLAAAGEAMKELIEVIKRN